MDDSADDSAEDNGIGSNGPDPVPTTPEMATPDPATPRSRRWWPVGTGSAIFVVTIWILLFTWSGIRGSHPAYLIMLIMVALGSALLVTWAARSSARQRPPLRNWLSRAALVIAGLFVIGVVVYLRPLPADQVAIDALADDAAVDVSVSSTEIRMDPVGETRPVGLVFYPGAKVDPRAYARILRPIAEDGFTVVILKLPFNIAFFAIDGADDVVGNSNDFVDRWLIGGHSLGGTVAAMYVDDHANDPDVAGLLLWASFPARSIAEDLDVLSVSASNDRLATPADIVASRDDLPATTDFVEIDGAVHAFFGDYGTQSGDGTPTVTREAAQQEIIAATLDQLLGIASE